MLGFVWTVVRGQEPRMRTGRSKMARHLAVVAVALSSSGPLPAVQGAWTSHGPYGGLSYALAIDPQTPTTIYAGTYGGGVFKSLDSGAHWFPINAGLLDRYVTALQIQPDAPETVYAGTYDSGVFKSTDGGASWIALSPGMTGLEIRSLAIDPNL